MEANNNFYFSVELKLNYFHEFVVCGVPVPKYSNDTRFILKFDNAESYISYTNLLKTIMNGLKMADPACHKYEIQHSIIFIKNLLRVMREQLCKTYN
jgi:hypothetical protein